MTDVLTTGSCLCGKVSYTITGQPIRMAQCHCIDCQKVSGTGHISQVFIWNDQIDITGEVKSYACTADSGNTVTRLFCPSCGSRMFATNSSREHMIGVSAGTMDNHAWFKPDAVLYTKDQPVWDITTDDAPRFEAMPTKA